MNYAQAISLLKDTDPLQVLLQKYLIQVFIPDFVSKTYSKIERKALIELLGLKTDAQLLTALSPFYHIEGDKFVCLKPKFTQESQFNLSRDKVIGLAQVAQFLEK